VAGEEMGIKGEGERREEGENGGEERKGEKKRGNFAPIEGYKSR